LSAGLLRFARNDWCRHFHTTCRPRSSLISNNILLILRGYYRHVKLLASIKTLPKRNPELPATELRCRAAGLERHRKAAGWYQPMTRKIQPVNALACTGVFLPLVANPHFAHP
jgi:hypothetical protein